MGSRQMAGWTGLAAGILALLGPAVASAAFPAVLRSDFSDLCLEIDGGAAADGTPAVQSSCDGETHQRLTFTPANSQVNMYTLRPAHSSRCLQIADGSTSSGAALQQAGCDSGSDQQFELLPQGDGSYQIRARHSGLVLELATADTTDGTGVVQRTSSASATQRWRLANADFSDPATSGRWGDVIPWPHIAVSAANLPDGRILTFSGSERETWPSTEFTYSATWDPVSGSFQEIDHVGHNMFCAHLAMTADGQVFVNGGRNQTNSPWTSLFSFEDSQWTQIDNMTSGGRWYPTTVALTDGDMFTAIGTATNQRNPDRWDPETGWRTMTGIDFQEPVLNYQSTHGEWRWWPLLHVAPQGKLFHSGPTPTVGWINTTGSGQYEDTGIRQDDWYHKHGTTIMYDEGRILTAGGWIAGNNTTSTNQAFTIDLNGPSPVIQPTDAMAFARKFHNGIMLPNGEVLVVGGNTSGQKFSDNGAVLPLEIWNPDTGTWRTAAEMTIPRNYHSIALLLNDGRVLAAGSGYCSGNRYCSGASHRDGQVYEPAYLFNADGSYATRPAIESGPGFVEVGGVYDFTTDSPVAYFSMIKLGATTHGMNTDVRYLRPDAQALAGNTYRLTANGNPNVLTAGYWMVFAVSADGVPSEAHVVRVTSPDVRHPNVALSGSVTQSSTAIDGSAGALVAGNAIDGDMTGTASSGAIAQTESESNAWWQIDLNSVYDVQSLRLWSRDDAQYLADLYVLVSAEPFTSADLETERNRPDVTAYYVGAPVNGTLDIDVNQSARYLRVQRASSGPLALTEFQVFAEPPGAGAAGLVHFQYFDGDFNALPDFSTLIPTNEGVIDGFQLSPAGSDDRYAFRFYGQLFVDATGTYTFYSESSDGSRLLVNGVEIVGNDGVHGVSESAGSVFLEAGSHDIAVEYFDAGNSRHLQVSYEGPGKAKQVIPADQLALMPAPSGSGEILREWWTNIPNVTLSDLLADPDYPDNPDGSDIRDRFEAPINWNDNYGTRMRGFLHPPQTGYYRFWISSDDHGELWLSTDESSANLARIAHVPGWTSSRLWDKYPEQRSAPVFLERGQRYYVEALMKEAGGGDNLAVGWQSPMGQFELIDGTYLSQFSTPLTLVGVDAPPQESSGDVIMTADALGDGLIYSWSFGDGTPDTAFSSDPSVAHQYAGPGRYTATVTVRDAQGDEVQQAFQQIVHAPLTADRPAASASITYHGYRAEVWNVNPDNDSVTVIDANADARVGIVPVPANPRSLTVAGDGRVWVSSKGAGSVSIIDPSTLTVAETIALHPGARPHGIVADPTGGTIYVALEGAGEVVAFDALSLTELARQSVGPNVRHLSVTADGSRVLVSRFITPKVPGEHTNAPDVSSAGGEVLVLDSALNPLDTVLLAHSDVLPSEHSGPGLPNYLGAPAISPDGQSAWVPAKQDNVLRGSIRDGLPLVFDQAVRAISSKIELGAMSETLTSRIDHDNASVPTAAAFDPYGVFLYTALEGNRQVAVADPFTSSELLRFDAGRAPQGLAMSPSGDKLFVHNFMDRSVTIHDLRGLHGSGALDVPLLATVDTVSSEALAAGVLLGKQFFYDSRDTRLATQAYLSCASCHSEGGQDGRVWDFTQFGEGLRNTITLVGRGSGHGNAHWTANFDEIQDFEGQIRSFALGTGLMDHADFSAGTRSEPLGDPKAGVSSDLDALAAYLGSLTEVPASPLRPASGELGPAAEAGRDLFHDLDCGSCHGGNALTDSESGQLHDIGTLTAWSGGRLGEVLTGIDTPSLLAIHGTGPYLHDGSADTLADAVRAHANVALLDHEADDLAAFVAEMRVADLAVTSSGPNLYRGSLTGVSDVWQIVDLPASYADMVVIATPEYGPSDPPVVTRIRNAQGSAFELRVQNPGDTMPVSGYTVRFVVVEAGVYNAADHGIDMEAAKVSVSTTDDNGSWRGEAQNYANGYAQPVVLGQVMSANDPSWSVFWASDGNTGNPPSASSLYVGKHVAEDPNTVRASETLGYIVLEAGVGTWDGSLYSAGVGGDLVMGLGDSGAPYTYPIGFYADTAVLSSAGMDGTNGGWPVLHAAAPLPAAELAMGVDEDQLADAERIRTTDQLAYLAFGEPVTGPIPKLAMGTLSNVSDAWQTVTLPESYDDMVVIATPEYSPSDLPVVTRIRNAAGNQFEVRVQNPGDAPVGGYTVRYLAVEAGVYTALENGIRMEAVKFTSTRTDRKGNWQGQSRNYANAYNNPVVLGQVMTANDASWSVFYSTSSSRTSPANATSLKIGKHVGEDPNTARADETLGYIVIETGSVMIDGVTFDAGVSADNLRGASDSGGPYSNALATQATNIVLSSAAMDGGDGGWPMLDAEAPLGGGTFSARIDEDQENDAERNHTTEQVSYFAVEE